MHHENSAGHQLAAADFDKIKRLGTLKQFKQGEQIFADGDSADYIYFIESGHVSIYIEKFNRKEEVSNMGAGEYFGEMAFFSGDRRSASAAALLDSSLLLVDKSAFLNLFENDQDIASKINRNFSRRNRELASKEHLAGGDIRIGIKGDPSLCETAFSRERYDSVVDKILPDLQPRLYDLLLNRSVYEVFIHCNSGEVRIRTVFDPFNDEIHPAGKLLNIAYIERHFPLIAYEEKNALVQRMHSFILADASYACLQDQLKEGLGQPLTGWRPVSQADIASTISRLTLLRKIPNFYLRNFSMSTIRNAIRMQFNCDGTHIVSARGFLEFIEENLEEEPEEAKPANERRQAQRRDQQHSGYIHGERRSPPGRRQEDWQAIIAQSGLDA